MSTSEPITKVRPYPITYMTTNKTGLKLEEANQDRQGVVNFLKLWGRF